jgi:hypothetical protein
MIGLLLVPAPCSDIVRHRLPIASINAPTPVQAEVISATAASRRIRDITDADPRALMAIYAERTSELPQKIYSRAGVYLLVGVLIAFVGPGSF